VCLTNQTDGSHIENQRPATSNSSVLASRTFLFLGCWRVVQPRRAVQDGCDVVAARPRAVQRSMTVAELRKT
jgi:hypothetical protein